MNQAREEASGAGLWYKFLRRSKGPGKRPLGGYDLTCPALCDSTASAWAPVQMQMQGGTGPTRDWGQEEATGAVIGNREGAAPELPLNCPGLTTSSGGATEHVLRAVGSLRKCSCCTHAVRRGS